MYSKQDQIEQQWKKELKNPPSEDLEYIGEVDISRKGKQIYNLAMTLSEIPGLNQDNTVYTSEQKIKAVCAYFLTGKMSEAARYSGVTDFTIRKWKQTAPWWDAGVKAVKRAKQEQLDTKLTNLLEKSMSELRDRLMNGDEVISKAGRKQRIKIKAKDLAVISSILYDKRTQLRKDPNNTPDKEDKEDTLNKLKADFEKLSRDINAKTVDGEATIINEQRKDEQHDT